MKISFRSFLYTMPAELIREDADTETSLKWNKKISCIGRQGVGVCKRKGEDMPIYEYRCEKCGQVNEFLILERQESAALQAVRERGFDEASVRSQYSHRPVAWTY